MSKSPDGSGPSRLSKETPSEGSPDRDTASPSILKGMSKPDFLERQVRLLRQRGLLYKACDDAIDRAIVDAKRMGLKGKSLVSSVGQPQAKVYRRFKRITRRGTGARSRRSFRYFRLRPTNGGPNPTRRQRPRPLAVPALAARMHE